jgi:hypothetical protein
MSATTVTEVDGWEVRLIPLGDAAGRVRLVAIAPGRKNFLRVEKFDLARLEDWSPAAEWRK